MTAHEGLPEGITDVVAWGDHTYVGKYDEGKKAAQPYLHQHGPSCEGHECVELELGAVGTALRISALEARCDDLSRSTLARLNRSHVANNLRLEARCGELEAMQPREWTAETIKGAPEGLYFGKSADKWRTDRSFSKMIIDGFLAAANAQRGRGEEGPRFPYTHYFGPIPQPSSNSRKEGEG